MRGSLVRNQGPRIVQPIVKNSTSPLLSLVRGPSSGDNSLDSIDLDPSKSNEIIKVHHPIHTPASELSENRPLLHSVSSMIFDLNDVLVFEVEPTIMASQPDELNEVFKNKCSQCLQVCDFSTDEQEKEKNEKSQILQDILNAVSSAKVVEKFGEEEYLALYHMFRRNVIRTTPMPPDVWFAPVSIDFTIDRMEERGWVHLKLFYDILIAFISNPKFNPNLCSQECHKLLKGVISMFQSPDNRERERIMELFHGMYRTMKKLRNLCRSLISQFLSTALYIPQSKLGISELLNAYVPIIAGFKVPVLPENKEFFNNVLLPLHESPYIHLFHTSLVNAVTAFLKKDEKAVGSVYEIMVTHWPVTSPTKQILFLNEMEILSALIKLSDIDVIKKICKTISMCSSSENFAVAERSLMLWESDSFLAIIASTSKETYPILIPEIYKTASTHWCADVRKLAINAMRVLKGRDLQTFERLGTSFKRIESEKIMKEISKGKFWNTILENNIKDQNEQEALRNVIRKIFIGCEALNKSIEPTVISQTDSKRSITKASTSLKSTQTIYKTVMSQQQNSAYSSKPRK